MGIQNEPFVLTDCPGGQRDYRGAFESLKGYLLLGVAVVTCPCHLPILLALVAGTSLATLLSQHVGLVFGGLALIFVVSLLLGLRALRRESAPRTS